MQTEYKGYTIETSAIDGRLRVTGPNAKNAFNPDGYASLNAAKGAITKCLNGQLDANRAAALANPAQLGRDMAQLKPTRTDIKPLAATSDDKSRLTVSETEQLQIAANAVNATIAQEADAHNFDRIMVWKARQRAPKRQNVQSRAQREGRYSGQVNGKPARYYVGAEDRTVESFTSHWHFPNRKARKVALVNLRNSKLNRPQYGGRIITK